MPRTKGALNKKKAREPSEPKNASEPSKPKKVPKRKSEKPIHDLIADTFESHSENDDESKLERSIKFLTSLQKFKEISQMLP